MPDMLRFLTRLTTPAPEKKPAQSGKASQGKGSVNHTKKGGKK